MILKVNWIRRILRYTKLYTEYNQCRDLFKEPQAIMFIGKWRSCPGLPVYRGGHSIWIAKYRNYSTNKTGKEQWMYNPNNDNTITKWRDIIWCDSYKEKHPIFTKIFKPVYHLPYWMTFKYYSCKLQWKWKWDDVRFEFNPQMTLVMFGYCISIWLKAPYKHDYDYWESMLTYLYKCNKNKDEASKSMGVWKSDEGERPAWNKEFLKKS